MKRDMDLVRSILLTMEADPTGYAPEPFTIAEYDPHTVGHHVWLMEQGGLVTADDITSQNDPSPIAIPLSVTWKGHEFLAAVRSATVWEKVKTDVKGRVSSLPLTVLQEVALTILKAQLALGMP